jgi:hypothetical protein
MAYIDTSIGNLGGFGKSSVVPPPMPPEDLGPTITPEEELAILEELMPGMEPQPSFLRRNAMPLLVGGGVLLLGTLGLVLMVKV